LSFINPTVSNKHGERRTGETLLRYLGEMSDQGYHAGAIGLFHKIMIPYLVRSMGIGAEDLVVDIGAGHGHALIPLFHAGFRNLVAVDREDVSFDLFAKKYGIGCCMCDLTKDRIPIGDGSVGGALCLHMIEHLSSPENLLREIVRILKPGGAFCIVTPDWRKQYRTFYRDPTHVRPYDREGIARLLRMYDFRSIEVGSWGSAWGLGRLGAYRFFPHLGMIGADLLARGRKRGEEDDASAQ
jgi:SAM-dependent methyltransferase